MSLMKTYLSEIRSNLGYLATWVPGRPMRLGDVGVMQEGVFERTTTLEDLGIPFRVRQDHRSKSYSHRSKDRIAVQAKLAGASSSAPGLADAEAGLVISTAKEGGVLLDARDCSICSIENYDEVGRSILELHASGAWPSERRVITEIVKAGCATIVILDGDSGQIVLRAKAAVGLDALEPANADAGFTVAREQSVGLRIIADSGLVPLYAVSGVTRRIIRPNTFARRRLYGDANEPGSPSQERGEYVFDNLIDEDAA